MPSVVSIIKKEDIQTRAISLSICLSSLSRHLSLDLSLSLLSLSHSLCLSENLPMFFPPLASEKVVGLSPPPPTPQSGGLKPPQPPPPPGSVTPGCRHGVSHLLRTCGAGTVEGIKQLVTSFNEIGSVDGVRWQPAIYRGTCSY